MRCDRIFIYPFIFKKANDLNTKCLGTGSPTITHSLSPIHWVSQRERETAVRTHCTALLTQRALTVHCPLWTELSGTEREGAHQAALLPILIVYYTLKEAAKTFRTVGLPKCPWLTAQQALSGHFDQLKQLRVRHRWRWRGRRRAHRCLCFYRCCSLKLYRRRNCPPAAWTDSVCTHRILISRRERKSRPRQPAEWTRTSSRFKTCTANWSGGPCRGTRVRLFR